ncbi:MAG: yicC [Deltaproteobacteria bacterium]|nr:yicC [Deltaproteobacteria bacterium]
MIRSMTGYGKAEEATADGKLAVELRSVNHRYGEITVKLPRQFLALEGELKKRIAERCKRGKIDAFVQFEASAGGSYLPQVNLPLAKAYHDAFVSMNLHFGNYEPVPLALIVAQRDVLSTQEMTADLEKVAPPLFTTLAAALERLEQMRASEGESLAAEITGRVAAVTGLVEKIASRAPLAVAGNSERFRERIARLLGDTQLDESRLAQEVALLADKMEITEELVRLRSHFQQFAATMQLDEPVGRKLDFLLQEMNREVNTIGSKANDGEIAAMVVELKAEMEKVREQIQNIE